MKKGLLLAITILSYCQLMAQTNPAITSWLQNTTNTGSYYMEGNSTAIDNGILYNCQKVDYSDNYVYVTATGIPAYPTGPFLDGNPSLASNQDAIFKIPLNPTENTGAKTATRGGNIGIFINGVALFDYRDGVAWNPNTNGLCGGPGNDRCPGGPMAQNDWNRDAIPAERAGFDCSKGHPAMGNYHHHQNPSAFKLDIEVTSTICNLYDADGLYTINTEEHSPLIGFAYDGFPIYGAYGYKNADGTGGIERIKSGYQLRDMTTRTNGPEVDDTYLLGYFREDYEFVENEAAEYLDEHNGRFCITPEYPDGTYAYFATVNEDWTSAYPYAVGPTYYGVVEGESVASITETVTPFDAIIISSIEKINGQKVTLFPNPAADLVVLQIEGLLSRDLEVRVFDTTGREVLKKQINQGSTVNYIDTQTLYNGTYLIHLDDGLTQSKHKVVIIKG